MGGIMELFKMQVLMKYMGEAGSPAMSFLFMILMSFYDTLTKQLPYITAFVAAWVATKYRARYAPPTAIKNAVEVPKLKPVRSFIQFERVAGTTVVDPRIDAVIHYVCNLPEAQSLRFNGMEFMPNFTGPLLIDTDIWFETLPISASSTITNNATNNEKRGVEGIVYKLSSYDHDIRYIHKFVETTIYNYEQEKKNKLGNEMYYFDHVTAVGKGHGRMPVPNGFCAFRKSKFQSNRMLDNVYFKECDDLKSRVDFFMRRKDWYDTKGVPHTLGIVMWGHPGCGKTSTIKAIANETKRHIFNISLSQITTREALKDLFYNDAVNIYTGDKIEQLTIPIRQRLYVIEDIDAMDSVVIKRTPEELARVEAERQRKREEKEKLMNQLGRGGAEKDEDELDLATMLNVLDGVRETPGRIIILSTNYPERLDEALLRPGRFDIIIEFAKHSCDVLRAHIEKFYERTLSAAQWARLNVPALDKKWTPAEVSQILFKHIHAMDGAVNELVEKEPKELFRFSQLAPQVPLAPTASTTSIESSPALTPTEEIQNILKEMKANAETTHEKLQEAVMTKHAELDMPSVSQRIARGNASVGDKAAATEFENYTKTRNDGLLSDKPGNISDLYKNLKVKLKHTNITEDTATRVMNTLDSKLLSDKPGTLSDENIGKQFKLALKEHGVSEELVGNKIYETDLYAANGSLNEKPNNDGLRKRKHNSDYARNIVGFGASLYYEEVETNELGCATLGCSSFETLESDNTFDVHTAYQNAMAEEGKRNTLASGEQVLLQMNPNTKWATVEPLET